MKNRRHKGAALALAIIGHLTANPAIAAGKPQVPTDGERLFILGQDQLSISQYMADVELPRPKGFATYTTLTRGATETVTNYCFKGLDGLKNLDNYNSNSAAGCADSERRNQWGSGVQNAQWVIETYQPEVLSIGMFCPGNDQAQDVYQNGSHDDLLTELGDFFKLHQNTRFFLRTCYEFNGDAHGLSFDSFRGIYKHVKTFLDAQGVTNVAHVWQSDAYHGTGRITTALGDSEQGYWPGKQYVDWVGVSQFNSDVAEEADIAEAEGLPLFIAEATPHGDLGVQYDFSLGFGANEAQAQGQANPVTAVNNLDWFSQKNAEIMRTSSKAWHYINADWKTQPQWQNALDQAGANFFKYSDSRVQQSAPVKSHFIDLVSAGNGFILAGQGNAGPVISGCSFNPAGELAENTDVTFSCQVADSPEGVDQVDLSVNGLAYPAQGNGDGSYSWLVSGGDLQPGSNALVISAVDNSAATSTQSHSVSVVDTAPLQPVASEGITVDGSSAWIYFVDQGWSGSWNYICLNDNCIAGSKVGDQWQRDISGSNIVVGNTYNIQLKVQDNASGQYISPNHAVVAALAGSTPPAQNVPPEVSIAPLSGLVDGDTASVAVSASDSDGSITQVSLYVTAPGMAEQLQGSDTTAPYEFSLTSVVEGSYSLRAVVLDNDNAETQASSSFTVAATTDPQDPPTTTADYGIELDGSTAILFFVDQGWTGSWHYLCLADNCVAGSKNGSRWERDISSFGIVAGNSYVIQLKIQDNSSGQYISPLHTVVAAEAGSGGGEPPVPGNQPPNISVSTGSGFSEGDSATIVATASDSDGSIASVVLYATAPNASEQLLATLTQAPYQFNLANLVVGTYSLRALATDDDAAQSQASSSFVVAGVGGGGGSPDFDHLDWTSNSLTEHNVGPAPRANPPAALATPENGAQASSHGFAFDIANGVLSWRWGASIVKQSGDSGLEMHCSVDNNATFTQVAVVNGQATIPCQGDHNYFFRYLHPNALNDDPGSQWIFTALFTTQGARVNVNSYAPFVDGSANWMRFRHPVSHDGTTAAVLDAQHNNDRLRNLDRYTIWVEDSPGNVQIKAQINGSVLRNEAMRRAGSPNGQQFFAAQSSGLGWGGLFGYGQVISFEFTAVAGATGAQTYNDFSHYVVGCGWCGKYGDPRLNAAGKASTSQEFSDAGGYIDLEHNAIFTQPMVTIHKEDMIDDFLLGHHLFHGVDPNKVHSAVFDDADAQIGETTCGNCHFRDGRGSGVVTTAKGPRIAPPIFGLSLLDHMIGREAGYTWDGSVATIEEQVSNALLADHKVNAADLPGRVFELLTTYVESLTVPARAPGSYDLPGVSEGDVLFNQTGCASCHTPVQRTSPDAPTHIRDLEIRPYTDMKLHDLGNGNFRTAPLWGLGHNLHLLERNNRAVLYLHDGSATTLEQAINAHGGAAQSVTGAYNQLSSADKTALKNFVKTL